MSSAESRNPFNLVKATDLTDLQIESYWVDLPDSFSLVARVNPQSPVPMFILGGKGSGKTHLMRYLSYPLQKLRVSAPASVGDHIHSEGYLGIYVLSGGLNGSRFRGKGQDTQRWQDIFAYTFELWLAQILLGIVEDILKEQVPTDSAERDIAVAVIELFDRAPFAASSLGELRHGLRELQKEADLAINNASATRQLEVDILSTRGSLFFGVPRVLCEQLSFLRTARILYLIDEFENFTEQQQTYINTLIRERTDPVGIKVGARLYGLRTYATLSAGEDNRPDSEFEILKLDAELRDRPTAEYKGFVERLFVKRLIASGYLSTDQVSSETIAGFFEEPNETTARQEECRFFRKKYADRDRPYMVTLRKRLEAGVKQRAAMGVNSAKDIEQVLADLTVKDDPFCEKLNTFLLYRSWAAKKDIPSEAQRIGRESAVFLAGGDDTIQRRALEHWRADVWAQLRQNTDRHQLYVGFDAFVTMSAGLPRCVLTTLKHIFSWALFYGEHPFGGKPISTRAQRDGVAAATDWFFSEARAPGKDGAAIRSSMTQLGELLRALRFSDKPPECSLSTFSVDRTTATDEAIRIVEAAELWSMLIATGSGQHERNSGRVDPKYRVHPMLAPRWDLPYASRGAIGLSGSETSAIFDDAQKADFPAVREARVSRTMAPLFGRSGGGNPGQAVIPGVDGD